ncbi:hypothetical protein GGP41_009975 [Bipolaris sorokiniana]|uniref:Uncharacterized protein n=1 Tax=Cochliobolus sativus TaxID=45130 RepID=A0A8H6DUZ4_COCSA|nr:hypothetical protein GGP41_009975 [Bipolaris sorokiniana]
MHIVHPTMIFEYKSSIFPKRTYLTAPPRMLLDLGQMHAGHGKKVQVGCARITPPLSPTLAISLAVSLAISPAPTSTNPD